jgi:hypothetical protein
LSPVSRQLSYAPSRDPTYTQYYNKTSNSSLLDASDGGENSLYIKISFVSIIMISCIILALFYINFRYVYKFVMDRLGYDFKKPMILDATVNLRVASLDECIQHFWEYRTVIYKRGTVTDDLFSRFDVLILNALDNICMNPNILCPVSYYKVVCHMAHRKSDAIRNKAYETLLICKSTMSKCITVECIQLLRCMFIDCGRIDVKEHVVIILCEISHSNPKLITFDIYDMLRSYAMTTSDMSLSHAIEITLQEIRQYCVHLHTEIDEYEKSLLPTCYDNENMESDSCENKYDVSSNENSDISDTLLQMVFDADSSSSSNNKPINYFLDFDKTSMSNNNNHTSISNISSNSEIENIITFKEYISHQEVSNDNVCNNSSNNSSRSSSSSNNTNTILLSAVAQYNTIYCGLRC